MPVTSKSSVKRFGECGVEGVEVDQCVKGDNIVGQNASRMVNIDCYSVTYMGGQTYFLFFFAMEDSKLVEEACQSPGLIISSKQRFRIVSSSADSSVAYSYINLSFPFHLPVTTTRQSMFTQHLGPEVKSF